jgi:simple sugar transport system permease protein
MFASLGGMYSERSGVINIALEGMMLMGAFAAAAVNLYTGDPWLGIFAGAMAGLSMALILAVLSVFFHADQVVAGTAVNILAAGLAPIFSNAFFGTTGSTPSIQEANQLGEWSIPLIQDIPFIGGVLGTHSPLVFMALVIGVMSWWVLFRTPFGLRIRAAGEHPDAVATSGISVVWTRFQGVLISGFLAGLGGAFLSIGHGSAYARNMTSGRGFIALAALIFGKWHPYKAMTACFLFGFADAIQIQLQGSALPILGKVPVQLVQIFPYLLTIAVLAGWMGRSQAPAAIGKPYGTV